MRHFSDHIPVCIFFHSEAGEAGEGDMKDIDDIYDMENYDNDDSPGEYVVVISRARGMYSVWYLLHQSPRAINAIIPCIPSARDITSLYPVGIATIDTHRTLKKKEKAISFYSKQLHKATLSQISIELQSISLPRGVVKSTQLHTAIQL